MGRTAEKEVAESSKRISVWWLRKHGYLNGYSSGSMSWTWGGDPTTKSSITLTTDTNAGLIRLQYYQTDLNGGDKDHLDYYHKLVTTPCHYGGVRYWFKCCLSKNGIACGKRVGVLYKPPGALYWGCRHCYYLNYESQRVYCSNGLVAMLVIELKIEELEQKMKRRFWRGNPTRKYQRILKLCRKMGDHEPGLNKLLVDLKTKRV